MAKEFKGMFVAPVTPFTEDGALDEGAMRVNMDFMIQGGIDGVFAAGTYAEGALLGRDYEAYFKMMKRVVAGRVPIIAQIGAPDTKTAMELAAQAAETGLDAVAAIPPFYFSHDEDAIYSYYRDIVSTAKLPVFIYNNPFRSGNPVTPGLFERLAKLPGLVGIKDSSDNLLTFCRFVMAAPKGCILFIGSDDILLAGLVMGAVGAVLAISNVVPKVVADLYKAFKAGNYEEAKKLQYRLLEYRMAIKGPYIAVYKETLNLLGLRGGYTRRPLRGMTEDEKAKLKERLKAIRAL